jgi:hypothetical protein
MLFGLLVAIAGCTSAGAKPAPDSNESNTEHAQAAKNEAEEWGAEWMRQTGKDLLFAVKYPRMDHFSAWNLRGRCDYEDPKTVVCHIDGAQVVFYYNDDKTLNEVHVHMAREPAIAAHEQAERMGLHHQRHCGFQGDPGCFLRFGQWSLDP